MPRARIFRTGPEPGFRLTPADPFLIAFVVAATWLGGVYLPEGGLHYLPLYVGGTFFFFCNVARIGNRLEAFWYAPFTPYAAWSVYSGEVDWPLTLVIFVPLALVLTAWRITRGDYRGAFYRYLGNRGR